MWPLSIPPTMTLSGMHWFVLILQTAAGFLIPAALALLLWKRAACRRSVFFLGCAAFFVFAVVLESLVNAAVLGRAAGHVIHSRLWLFALYEGLMAGLFEGLGRTVVFHSILHRGMDEDKNALMYGAGHGGFECFYLLVSAGVAHMLLAAASRTGQVDTLLAHPLGNVLQLQTALEELAEAAPAGYLLAILERCVAIAMHMSLSVLAWFGVKKGTGLQYVALTLHVTADFLAVFLSPVILPAGIVALFAALTVGTALLARHVWKRSAEADTAAVEGT